MGVPPMSLTGVSPVVVFFPLSPDNSKDTGGTPVRLMGKMPMLHCYLTLRTVTLPAWSTT
jgi:hypothetical protein